MTLKTLLRDLQAARPMPPDGVVLRMDHATMRARRKADKAFEAAVKANRALTPIRATPEANMYRTLHQQGGGAGVFYPHPE